MTQRLTISFFMATILWCLISLSVCQEELDSCSDIMKVCTESIVADPPILIATKLNNSNTDKASIGVYIEEKNGKLFIKETVKGGPAQKGGLRVKDQILKIKGAKIKDLSSLQKVMASVAPGEKIPVALKGVEK